MVTGRSRWVELRWPVQQGLAAHVGRIWGASGGQRSASGGLSGLSLCRRACTHIVGVRYARDLDHGTYTIVFASKSRSRGYNNVLCEYEKNGPFRLFSCFFFLFGPYLAFSVSAPCNQCRSSAAGNTSPVSISQLGKSVITACRFSNLQLGRLQLGSAEPARFSAVELVRTSSVHRSRVTDLATDL